MQYNKGNPLKWPSICIVQDSPQMGNIMMTPDVSG